MTDEIDLRQEFAEQVGELHERAIAAYSPVVGSILHSGCRDACRIETTLDGLLDFCGNAAVLQLFRRLCRHCHGINPAAAVSYVHAYQSMYGSESDPGSDGGGE